MPAWKCCKCDFLSTAVGHPYPSCPVFMRTSAFPILLGSRKKRYLQHFRKSACCVRCECVAAIRARRVRGQKMQKTMEKEAAREFVRRTVTENLGPLLAAQIDNAQGIRHLMMRDPKTGQFVRVTGDAREIDKALKTKNAVWIYTKDPSVQAFTDLLNRAIDKPAEHIQVAGAGSITIRWQKDDGEKESGEVRELSEDERLRRARRVNGHVDNGESS